MQFHVLTFGAQDSVWLCLWKDAHIFPVMSQEAHSGPGCPHSLGLNVASGDGVLRVTQSWADKRTEGPRFRTDLAEHKGMLGCR
jgi:hypothetical protein